MVRLLLPPELRPRAQAFAPKRAQHEPSSGVQRSMCAARNGTCHLGHSRNATCRVVHRRSRGSASAVACKASRDEADANTTQEEAEQRKYWGPPPEERDEDGLYIGEYSNLFTDTEQLKGIVIFCAFLASFFAAGNVLTTLLLSLWYGQAPQSCWQEVLLGYPCS
mmetsp:Transcript_1001/g.3540  ORF Transcript_1001/g.3540 Transcript_1001/m.3540 type:complete len:165 (-) Transcript_1001:126-620(-)